MQHKGNNMNGCAHRTSCIYRLNLIMISMKDTKCFDDIKLILNIFSISIYFSIN